MEKKYVRVSRRTAEQIRRSVDHVIEWPKIPTMDKKLIVEGSSPGHFYRELWKRFDVENMPPATIEEQATAMIDCVKAGAAAVHTHINAPTPDSCANGPYHSLDADLEGDIFDRMFEEVDALTLNHGWFVKRAESGDRKADYVTYHKELIERGKGNKYIQGSVIMTWNKMGGPHSADVIAEGVKYMEEHGIKPIWNLHIDHLMWVKRNFLDTGLCSEPYIINLQMGKHRDERYFADPWSHLGVIYEINLVKEALRGSKYTIGIHPEGRNWLPVTVMGMMLGCDLVRIGIEDIFWLYPHRDEFAKSPAEVVAKIVTIAKELGREIATPEEARKILGIKLTSE
jgi:3-keto-5-aminohexanoate cleavage enzyme